MIAFKHTLSVLFLLLLQGTSANEVLLLGRLYPNSTRLIIRPKRHLEGTLPSEIEQLSHLIDLDLGTNLITGTIPTTIGNLQALKNLNLRDNLIEGTIPTTIGSLESLSSLNLGTNQLAGTIPTQIGLLCNLYYLELGENQLTDTIPIEFVNLGKLLSLQLYSNDLRGRIPTELKHMGQVTLLTLSSNPLLCGDPEYLPFSKLAGGQFFLRNTSFSIGTMSMETCEEIPGRSCRDTLIRSSECSFCQLAEDDDLKVRVELVGGSQTARIGDVVSFALWTHQQYSVAAVKIDNAQLNVTKLGELSNGKQEWEARHTVSWEDLAGNKTVVTEYFPTSLPRDLSSCYFKGTTKPTTLLFEIECAPPSLDLWSFWSMAGLSALVVFVNMTRLIRLFVASLQGISDKSISERSLVEQQMLRRKNVTETKVAFVALPFCSTFLCFAVVATGLQNFASSCLLRFELCVTAPLLMIHPTLLLAVIFLFLNQSLSPCTFHVWWAVWLIHTAGTVVLFFIFQPKTTVTVVNGINEWSCHETETMTWFLRAEFFLGILIFFWGTFCMCRKQSQSVFGKAFYFVFCVIAVAVVLQLNHWSTNERFIAFSLPTLLVACVPNMFFLAKYVPTGHRDQTRYQLNQESSGRL